jgi:hypothetical protein
MHPLPVRAALAVLLLSVSASASGEALALGSDCVETTTPAVARERALPAFTRVSGKGPIDLHVGIGKQAKVVVVAPPELARLITTKVERGVLEIDGDGCWSSRAAVRVEITVPVLEGVALAGSGDVTSTTTLRGRLAVELSGSGDARLDLDVDRASVALAGSGDLVLRGRADRLEASVAGSGDVEAGGLRATSAAVDIAGSGDVEVDAIRTLRATIAGSGDVVYRGAPTVQRNVVGSGSVRRAR